MVGTKKKLSGSKLSKTHQARVVDTCVVSTLLFDCQIQTWRIGELKRMQSLIDKAYRFVWSRKNKPPLMQMMDEGKNMVDVRKELGVMSEMEGGEESVGKSCGTNGRLVKAVVLG